MASTTWKRITIPKAVYLPTYEPLGGHYKDSGNRVELTDTLEIRPGTNQIRINGVESTLLISTDSLRLDAQDCLVLDTPAPVRLSPSGGDYAVVGRVGQARAQISPPDPSWVASLPPEEQALYASHQAGPPETMQPPEWHTEDVQVQTITLRNGQTAQVLIDPTSGRIASAPFRTYDGPGTDKELIKQVLAEQAAYSHVVPAPTPVASQQQPQQQQPQQQQPQQPQPQQPMRIPPPPQPAPSGFPTLDGLIATLRGVSGFPQQRIAYLQINPAIYNAVIATIAPDQNAQTTSFEAAFAKIHTLKTDRLVIHVPEALSTDLKLQLTELIPSLSMALSAYSIPRAVILASTNPPTSLMAFCSNIIISLNPHPTDPRFITATILDSNGSPKSASFPVGPETLKVGS